MLAEVINGFYFALFWHYRIMKHDLILNADICNATEFPPDAVPVELQ